MADVTNTEKTSLQAIAEGASSSISSWDKMTNSMVDTIAPNSSQLDNLVSDFSNSSMLTNLLTSNSPTINIKKGLEELCKFIAEYDASKLTLKNCIDEFFKLMAKLVTKLITKICQQLVSALYNAVLKLRRMVVSKLKEFLSEYVADACMSGLMEHLDELMNPQNALSISEAVDAVQDIISDTTKSIDSAIKTLRSTISSIYEFFSGSAYAEAKAQYEAKCAEWGATVTGMNAVYQACVSPEAFLTAMDTDKRQRDAQRLAQEAWVLQQKMNALAENTVWAEAFWKKKWEQGLQFLYEMACSRTAAYVQSEAFGLTGGIQSDIKNFMQGCLFQQALKTAKNIDPDGLTSDVLNRINNLSQNGSMMDAYNIALAAGIDISSGDFQIELPSSNGWVSDIYGDPYMFSTETPINASQIANYLTADLPTTSELLDGTVSEEKLSKSYVSDNWKDSDTAAAAVSQTLMTEIAVNKEIVSGQEAVGRTITTTDRLVVSSDAGSSVQTVTTTTPVTKETTRSEVRSQYA